MDLALSILENIMQFYVQIYLLFSRMSCPLPLELMRTQS
jgi:hypothetical protein